MPPLANVGQRDNLRDFIERYRWLLLLLRRMTVLGLVAVRPALSLAIYSEAS